MEFLANGWSEQQIIENYPGVTHEDVSACLHYATEMLTDIANKGLSLQRFRSRFDPWPPPPDLPGGVVPSHRGRRFAVGAGSQGCVAKEFDCAGSTRCAGTGRGAD